NRVVDESEKQILPDVAHGGLAQLAGADNSSEVSFHQCDTAAFHGDIGAHGYSDVGLRQRRGVVDAVPGHRDHSSLPLQLADYFQLAFGQDFRFEFFDAQLFGNRGRDDAIVTRQHHNVNAESFQRVQGLGRGAL